MVAGPAASRATRQDGYHGVPVHQGESVVEADANSFAGTASRERHDLPLRVYAIDGEEEVTQAEWWLARPQVEQLVKAGIMAFLCIKGKASLKVTRIHSLALPPENHTTCDLQGHWGRPDLAPMPQRSTLPGVKVGLTADYSGEGEYAGHESPGLSPMAALESDAGRHGSGAKAAPTLSPLAHMEADAARHGPTAISAPTPSTLDQMNAEVAR